MKKFRTFSCTVCENKEDRLVSDEATEVSCNKCKSPAHLQLSSPKYFGNSTGRSPSAI